MIGRIPKPHKIVPVASMTVMPSRTPSRNDVRRLWSLRGGMGVPTVAGGLGAPGGGGEDTPGGHAAGGLAAPGGVAPAGGAFLVGGTRGLVGRSSGWAKVLLLSLPDCLRVPANSGRAYHRRLGPRHPQIGPLV